MKFNFVVLTYNEERHIKRCIESILPIAEKIYIVDSFSTDKTEEICRCFEPVIFVQNPFTNQASQFNWALDNLKFDGWIFRIDADEVLNDDLIEKLVNFEPQSYVGISVDRHIAFRGDLVRYGGLFPLRVVRSFKFGHARCENLEMDEHLVVDGPVCHVGGRLMDLSQLSIDEWILKHLIYSKREAYSYFASLEDGAYVDHDSPTVQHVSFKRFLKTHLFYRLPAGTRTALYFIYRFVCRFGFLDKGSAIYFHIFQGFWYRFLVDFRIFEIERYCKLQNVDYKEAFRNLYGFVRSK